MNFTLSPASLNEKSILRHLLELYAYDFSEFDRSDVDTHGLYGYDYLDNYWTEAGRYPFLIRIDDNLAGFVMFRTITDSTGNQYFSIAEFFIMRKYRKSGVGREAAFQIFDQFPGSWQVAEMVENVSAQLFWNKTIAEYTKGNFTEIFRDDEQWHGPIQSFDNAK